MRIVTGLIFCLTVAAHPASGSEAFIAQLTGKAVASEQAAVTASRTALASGLLALPLQLNAIRSPAAAAGVAGSNTSTLVQSGTGNFAAVAQTGGGNTSSITQRGTGNQAIVMQRQGAH
jgi:Curlin associated repeat